MGWQEFDPKAGYSRSRELWISLQQKKRLQISRGVVERLEGDRVVLLYDPEQHRIALRPDADSPKAVKIRKMGQQNSWVITAEAFCIAFGIDVPETRQYPVYFDENMAVFDLASGQPSSRARRRPRASEPS